MFATFDLAHVGTFDARPEGQCFLRNSLRSAGCSHRRTECQCWLSLEGGGAGGSATLNRALLHRQKRR